MNNHSTNTSLNTALSDTFTDTSLLVIQSSITILVCLKIALVCVTYVLCRNQHNDFLRSRIIDIKDYIILALQIEELFSYLISQLAEGYPLYMCLIFHIGVLRLDNLNYVFCKNAIFLCQNGSKGFIMCLCGHLAGHLRFLG